MKDSKCRKVWYQISTTKRYCYTSIGLPPPLDAPSSRPTAAAPHARPPIAGPLCALTPPPFVTTNRRSSPTHVLPSQVRAISSRPPLCARLGRFSACAAVAADSLRALPSRQPDARHARLSPLHHCAHPCPHAAAPPGGRHGCGKGSGVVVVVDAAAPILLLYSPSQRRSARLQIHA